LVGKGQDPPQRIGQQDVAQALPLNFPIYRELADQNNGERKPAGQFLGSGVGQPGEVNMLIRDRVIAEATSLTWSHKNINAGQATSLVLAAKTLNPIVQRGLAAVE